MRNRDSAETALLGIAGAIIGVGLQAWGKYVIPAPSGTALILTGIGILVCAPLWDRYHAPMAVFRRLVDKKLKQLRSLHGKVPGSCWHNHDDTRAWFEQTLEAIRYLIKVPKGKDTSGEEDLFVAAGNGEFGPQRPRRLLDKDPRITDRCSLCEEYASVENDLKSIRKYIRPYKIVSDLDAEYIKDFE